MPSAKRKNNVFFAGIQRLKSDQLAGHLLKVLNKEGHPLMLQLLCTDYSNLLMKDVLMRSSVCLSASIWHGMCVMHVNVSMWYSHVELLV